MKRVGHLFDAVVERENLLLAFARASRGKSSCLAQIGYAANLRDEIEVLRTGLVDGTYPVGIYTQFTIHDPKERIITAATFRERVLHHALMNVCERYFDKWQIFDSYASRRGKGQMAAVRRAQEFASHYAWFLKCDFRKYFDSIPHDRLKRMLRHKFKDEKVLYWFERIIDSYEVSSDRGLPIGNLTSQHLANHYLDGLDRKFHPYVRYMDDFIIWADDRDVLRRVRDDVARYAETELGLTLKEKPFINRSVQGMDFLGMRVYPSRIRLARKSRHRYMQRIRAAEWELRNGRISEAECQIRELALTAFVQQADTCAWRRSKLESVFA